MMSDTGLQNDRGRVILILIVCLAANLCKRRWLGSILLSLILHYGQLFVLRGGAYWSGRKFNFGSQLKLRHIII